MTGRKPSQATVRALERVAGGEPPYRAALAEGISPSTVYRALAGKRRADHPGIYWDDERRTDEHYLDRPVEEDEQ